MKIQRNLTFESTNPDRLIMIRLSVNLNKVALLRNSRGGDRPDLLSIAKDCESFGAQGITVHPRPDERHTRFADLEPLRQLVTTEFNIEGYPDERFMRAIEVVRPHQCTLVPDPPGALTSDTGWDVQKHATYLTEVVGQLEEWGVRSSIFLNPIPDLIPIVQLIGANRIELYTGPYAAQYKESPERAVEPYRRTAQAALEHGIEINAGHDLDLVNLQYYAQSVPGLCEVSIGHALIADALYFGLENTIAMYQRRLKIQTSDNQSFM